MDADISLNESTEINAGIEIKKDSDCGCSEEINIELNKKILNAFLKDGVSASVDTDLYEDLRHTPNFTTFSAEHMKIAHGVAETLVNNHEDDVDTMIDKLAALKNVYPNSAYADYLSRITFYKHPKTKNLICPPIFQVLPESFFSLDELREGRGSLKIEPPNTTRPWAETYENPLSLDLESKLNWWRGDIELSEHHANWHAYYPWNHRFDAELEVRRGELFAYMHEQMLARYDFERFAVGLPPVVPYGPGIYWDKPLDEGYNIDLLTFSARPANLSIPDRIVFNGTQYVIKDMEHHKERLLNAIARNEFLPLDPHGQKVPVTMDGLGCTVEANGNSVNPGYYGNLHNMGHVVISMMNDPDKRYGINFGPMYEQYTSARDPVFFRWHKFIDDLFEEHRVRLEPYSKIKGDLEIQLAHNTSLEVKEVFIMTMPDDGKKVEKDFLYTKMTKQTIAVYWAADTKDNTLPIEERYIDYPTLVHYPFHYHFKIELTRTPDPSENLDDDYTYKLMFRVFMAPQTHVKDLNKRRRHFVELDSFVQEVKWDSSQPYGTQTFEIIRKSEDSTVAMLPAPPVEDIQDGKLGDPTSFCGCGWPLNLLIPRGTAVGMKADLFVLVTDWEKDAYDKDAELSGGSAYCGKKGKPYPDRKPMGYPFDRNFDFKLLQSDSKEDKSENTLQDIVRLTPNSGAIPVTIQFLEDGSE